MPGDCFQTALNVHRLLMELDMPSTVCHGTPIGTGPENHGQRFWHAWVEVKLPGIKGWVVFDYSNGQRIRIKREAFYRAGNLYGGRYVWRFTPKQVIAASKEFGHVGPWVHNEEEYAI